MMLVGTWGHQAGAASQELRREEGCIPLGSVAWALRRVEKVQGVGPAVSEKGSRCATEGLLPLSNPSRVGADMKATLSVRPRWCWVFGRRDGVGRRGGRGPCPGSPVGKAWSALEWAALL